MTVRDIVSQVVEDVSANLNAYIQAAQKTDEDWFAPLSFMNVAPDWDTTKDFFTMGVYLSSPDGQVFTSVPKSSTVVVSLDCLLDDIREHSVLPELYLSAVVEYLRKKRYGVSSSVSSAQIARADLRDPVNAFMVAISITVYTTDFDYNL